MNALNEAMDDWQDELNNYIKELAKELNVSERCAGDVWYLRGRSRWTQEKENELIRLYKERNPPNMNEF
jgi:hypothetical protein